jgi:ankyrin repeat protein
MSILAQQTGHFSEAQSSNTASLAETVSTLSEKVQSLEKQLYTLLLTQDGKGNSDLETLKYEQKLFQLEKKEFEIEKREFFARKKEFEAQEVLFELKKQQFWSVSSIRPIDDIDTNPSINSIQNTKNCLYCSNTIHNVNKHNDINITHDIEHDNLLSDFDKTNSVCIINPTFSNTQIDQKSTHFPQLSHIIAFEVQNIHQNIDNRINTVLKIAKQIFNHQQNHNNLVKQAKLRLYEKLDELQQHHKTIQDHAEMLQVGNAEFEQKSTIFAKKCEEFDIKSTTPPPLASETLSLLQMILFVNKPSLRVFILSLLKHSKSFVLFKFFFDICRGGIGFNPEPYCDALLQTAFDYLDYPFRCIKYLLEDVRIDPIVLNFGSIFEEFFKKEQKKTLKILDYLFEKKCINVQLRDKHGRSLLHHACKNLSLDLITYLLEKDADINMIDFDFKTPIWYAFDHFSDQIQNDIKCIQHLLSQPNINFSHRDGDDLSFIDLPFFAPKPSLVLIQYIINNDLLQYASNCNDYLIQLCCNTELPVEVIKYFCQNASVNYSHSDPNASTALHSLVNSLTMGSAEGDVVELVNFMIEKGHPVNPLNSNSQTPLDIVASLKSPLVKQALLDHGGICGGDL